MTAERWATCNIVARSRAIKFRSGLGSGRALLRPQQAPVHERLGDLNRVQRRALAEVVGDAPEADSVLDRDILADSRDISRVLARGLVRGDVAARLALVEHHHAWGGAQDIACLVGRDRLLELD